MLSPNAMITPDDPKLTAFVLGELDSNEHAEVESAIHQSDELRQAVDELRETIALIQGQFANEPLPQSLVRIENQVESPSRTVIRPLSEPRRRRFATSLRQILVASILGLAVMIGLIASLPSRYSLPVAMQGKIGTRDSNLKQLARKEPANERDSSAVNGRSESGESLPFVKEPSVANGTNEPLNLVFDERRGRNTGTNPDDDKEMVLAFADPSDVSFYRSRDIEMRNVLVPSRSASSEEDYLHSAFDYESSLQQDETSRPHVRGLESVIANTREYFFEELISLNDLDVLPAQGLPQIQFEGKSLERWADASQHPEADSRSLLGLSSRMPAEFSEAIHEQVSKRERADVGLKAHDKPEPPKTWKRVAATANTSRLMIGDREELSMQGMQVQVRIDGFRARVVLDCFYFNDRDQPLEGTFKLRLPNDAALDYFAFGESSAAVVPVPIDLPKGGKVEKGTPRIETETFDLTHREFMNARGDTFVSLLPADIKQSRLDRWANVKEARLVPQEKAAFAYSQTVRRKVDPALVEWAGAGVFNARVFPLAPKKLHRIVIGYDVDLQPKADGWEFSLDLPEEKGECQVDVSIADVEGVELSSTPASSPSATAGESPSKPVSEQSIDQASVKLEANRTQWQWRQPTEDSITISATGAKQSLLISKQADSDGYFAAKITPNLPVQVSASSKRAVFAVDTSLSSDPEKFNVWLKLLESTLNQNRGSLEEFAVIFFDVEARWWHKAYVSNSPEQVAQLMEHCQSLSLSGATDLYAALNLIGESEWICQEANQPDLFLLSDGAATWGEVSTAQIGHRLSQLSIAGVYSFETGMFGTASGLLRHLAKQRGGSVFSVTNEAEVATAAVAYRNRPWHIDMIETDGGTDVMTGGAAEWIFPGQTITVAGRGNPTGNVILHVSSGEEKQTIRIPFDSTVESDLAERVYGQIAVEGLESLGRNVEEVTVAFARHFRISGQSCSLLMLETEEDYQRFNIKPEEDAYVVKSSPANAVIKKYREESLIRLADPKSELLNWLSRLEEAESLQFKIPTALKLAMEELPSGAYVVSGKALECKVHLKSEMPKTLDGNVIDLISSSQNYDTIVSLAQKQRETHGDADALKLLSNLIEQNPGNTELARDVAFTSMQWDLPQPAYFLLRQVAKQRPFEGHVYSALGQCLSQLGNTELAIIFYEVALHGQFPQQGADFRQIVSVEYLHLLRDIAEGRQMTSMADYAKARLESLAKSIPFAQADLVVSMMWNTDQTDVDLHVLDSRGEECFYKHNETAMGGRITADVTTGFGPEMFYVPRAIPGEFVVKAKYFGSNQSRLGTRCKLLLTVYENFGTPQEKESRHSVVLEKTEDAVDVTRIQFNTKL
jgi:tetratricopeptide (TPR) repeat protein